jgi:tetratricopeptide (TPR) repeat protein
VIKRIFSIFLRPILLVLTYFYISIRLTYKFYLVFNIITYAIIGVCIILEFVKLARKKDETQKFKIIEAVGIIFFAAAVLYFKGSVDNRNLLILKTSNQNIPVKQLLRNFTEARKTSEKYDSTFKTIQHKDNTIYFTDEFEPALKLVQAYLDKARQDNSRLFGDIATGELKVKFDYDEQVFKKRNPIFNDYAGLYSPRERTAYVFIKDVYSNALGLNQISSYLCETLLHEYTHHVFHKFLESNQIPEVKIPSWFNEGVAEYIGNEGAGGGAPEKMADFNELKTQEQWVNYSNNGYSVYAQSHYAVRQLTLIKGEKVIKDILLKVKDTDFDTAFKDASGISLVDYENDLKEDFKNGWKKYDKMVGPYTLPSYTDEKIEGLEKYVKLEPNNMGALLDLAHLYEGYELVDKAKATLDKAVESNSKNSLAWHRLALIHEKMNNFDGAVEAFEKAIDVTDNPASGYMNLSEALLLKDVNKAAATAQKVKELDKSNFVKKRLQAILDYQSSIKAGKPYEGCLQLIKSKTINNDDVKKALIEKLLKDYPHIKNSARSELVKIRGSLE